MQPAYLPTDNLHVHVYHITQFSDHDFVNKKTLILNTEETTVAASYQYFNTALRVTPY